MSFGIQSYCSELDSILNLIQSTQDKKHQADLYREAYMRMIFTDPDSALTFAERSTSISEEVNYEYGIASGEMYEAIAYHRLARYELAIQKFNRSAEIRLKRKNWKGLVSCYGNLANVYQEIGKYPEAIKIYMKSLKVAEKIGSKRGIASTYNNVGAVYKSMGNYDEALNYYEQGLAVMRELEDSRGISGAFLNMGNVYMKKDEELIADSLFQLGYEIKRAIGDRVGEANALMGRASIAARMQDLEKAIAYNEQSIAIMEELNDPYGLAIAYANLSGIYSRTGQHTKAFEYAGKAIELADYIDAPERLAGAYEAYAEASLRTDKFEDAAVFYKKYADLKLKLLSEANSEQIVKMSAQYESEKKANQIALQEVALSKGEVELRKRNIQNLALAGGLGLMLVLAIVIFRSYKQKQRDHEMISEQKLVVEEKNKEILDSIGYAKRLQDAILPPRKLVKEHLTQSFILYKPKDIVAGDFYWMENAGSRILYAVADCTGHGVPGAMVSVVCSHALNRCVKEMGLMDPGEILTQTRELVIERFERSEEEVKDGMDIALCVLDLEHKVLQYAGANNPLYHVKRLDGKENERSVTDVTHYISELKADKQPIGKYMDQTPFTTQHVQLSSGDLLYTFSDGFADQFGGKNGKKFKYRPFKRLLLEIKNEPMEKQHEILNEAFEEWRGAHEQIDDVCIIGVRV